jgi:fructose-1-phosphate kinase PfkB-like protein
LLSCGADGAVYASEEGIWRAVPPPVTEVNNVGAGDAALAGAIYAQMHSLPPEEIVRWAVAMGTATVQTDGTTFPTYQAVEAVLEHVAIKPVKG